ncbi:SDR family oxidoreductase [Marinobacterium sediminicola]|uniref:Nucleoside-diphosphate-sugar epimerase n=1 Tax=Marinobacterium sediminicola TaxID=518898 RepID=A0ABY1RZC0_9GAMM|nr:SDR family oxidoreductase [Marinobacterium sediminicola]ULG69166.1 SDR family oxidoreductase [Marinobacterium sediminicola]SMR73552.1 Nucleoside-diphosphate-sugar epimerase [Marinobacterium sediminicola]
MREQRVLIAGCGDIGTQLGLRLSATGAQVFGLRRTINQLPDSIHGIAADLSNPASLVNLPACDYLFYTAAAKSADPEVYRATYVDGLRHLLEALPDAPRHLFLASSTGVYHQHEHDWVDEQSPVQPDNERGRILLASEQLALNSGIPATVVRFSGIYGPGRTHLQRQVQAGIAAPAEPLHYSNRIHRDDCVGVLMHLLQRAEDGMTLKPLYLASDDAPTPIHEVMEWLAKQMGVKIKTRQPVRRGGSKRCSNRRLKASGYRFLYPDYRSGYASLLRG